MPEYLACLMSEDGNVLRSVRLVCPDDHTAKEYARQLADGHAIELWQDERQIDKFTRRDA
jgi:hypothetical protein